MAITPINNAMIPRTADVNLMKHQEDIKPVVDQQNIQVQVNQREDILNHQVLDPETAKEAQNDADAKNEGRGQYRGRRTGKKSKDGQLSAPADRVIKKQNSTSFDIKI